MGTAMAQGRVRALALASGVVCGSLFWGLCAAFGLAALMARWSGALDVVKAIGGVYLLWMAWKAAQKMRGTAGAVAAQPVREGYARTCARGLATRWRFPLARRGVPTTRASAG